MTITHLIRTALVASSLVVFPSQAMARQEPTTPGVGVLQRMHDRYSNSWYRTLTFTQSTIVTRAGGKPDTSTWYESLSGPSLLRIDQGLPSGGNGVIYTSDSSVGVRNGVVGRKNARGNQFLPLIMGVYLQPVQTTAAQLTHFGFDLSKSYSTTLDGRSVIVVGAASASDTGSAQFWVDSERLVLVRMSGAVTGLSGLDIRVGGYEQVGNAWLATRVRMMSPTFEQREEYRDWKANRALSPDLFDPAQWKTAPHWVNSGGN